MRQGVRGCIGLILMLYISACSSSVTVSVYVKRPPEVNVTKYSRIVVDPIESSSSTHNDGAAVRNSLIEKLLNSRIFQAVSDTRPYSTDESPTIVLSGAMSANEYSEKFTHSQKIESRKVRTPDGKRDTIVADSVVHYNEINGLLRISAQLRLRDLNENAILWSTSFDFEHPETSTSINGKPAAINVARMERNAIEEISNRLIQSFIARSELTPITLLKDDDMPELEQGNDKAEDQYWQDAARLYSIAVRKYASLEQIDKAYYNLACAHMVIGSFENAIKNFNEAVRREPGKTLYNNTLALCLRIRDENGMLRQYDKKE